MSPFDTPEALELNRARIEHLESLNLDLKGKRVLDVGCGVGHFSKWFDSKGALVSCVDARIDNIHRIQDISSLLWARAEHIGMFDIETDGPYIAARSRAGCMRSDGPQLDLCLNGPFDIVFCYGLLYHLENPLRALRNMAALCDGMLLLETIICDHPAPLLMLRPENPSLDNQGVSSLSTVPTISCVTTALAGCGFYGVTTASPPHVPNHPEFHWQHAWDLACERDGHPLRWATVAYKTEAARLARVCASANR